VALFVVIAAGQSFGTALGSRLFAHLLREAFDERLSSLLEAFELAALDGLFSHEEPHPEDLWRTVRKLFPRLLARVSRRFEHMAEAARFRLECDARVQSTGSHQSLWPAHTSLIGPFEYDVTEWLRALEGNPAEQLPPPNHEVSVYAIRTIGDQRLTVVRLNDRELAELATCH
jgi:hypothetical protein